jgi:RNA polymerase sigma-70 factor (ECF subfamily)
MGLKDDKKSAKPSIILPFPVENPKPRLSIHIDDADVGFLYMEYYPLVYHRCLAILQNEEDAKDAAQDVFEQIQKLNAKGQLKFRFKPKTYLSMAALNMGINRKKRARSELNKIYDIVINEGLNRFKDNEEQDCEIWKADIIDNGYDQEKAETIIKAILAEQDETTRKIYFYKYHDDMTLEQIGELVGLGKSAVQKRIKKFEEQFRAEWVKADK